MPAAPDNAVHRALADPRRTRLVEELRRSGELDANELARRLGLHANTIRWHLGVLQEAGVVASSPARTRSTGRPRILYRLTVSAPAAGRDEYRLLATILAGVVDRENGAARAEAAGRAWGRYLVRRPRPFERASDAEATEEVVDLLSEQGFAPEARTARICMRRCPFHELAETHGAIVCGVHSGLISGALDELGSELEVDGLDVFVRPDLCVARLRRRAA